MKEVGRTYLKIISFLWRGLCHYCFRKNLQTESDRETKAHRHFIFEFLDTVFCSVFKAALQRTMLLGSDETPGLPVYKSASDSHEPYWV